MRFGKRKKNGRWPAGIPIPSVPIKVPAVPADPGWLHEIKHDGYRLMVRKDGESVRISTRGGWDWTDRYPVIVAAARRLRPKSFVIDGEGVVEGEDGIADFNLLHSRQHDGRCYLIAFDMLEDAGTDIRHLPLHLRKQRLEQLLRKSERGIVYSEHLDGDGAAMFAAACKMGLEGIVSKRKDRGYVSGPCKHWVKVKNPEAPWRKRLEDV